MRVLMVSGSRARLPDPVYPLGAAIIGTVARRTGHEVSWFDALRHEDPAQALAGELASFCPDAICFSIRNIDSGAFPNPELHFEDHLPLVATCRRESSAPIVVGGSGFSLMPRAFARQLKPDCGVVGEGEGVIAGILEGLTAGREYPELVIADRHTGERVAPDRDLFDADWYYKHGGVANLQTKRGCPLKCVYCTYPVLEGTSSRKASPAAVVDEIEALTSLGIRHFFFVDAVFNRPESHAAEVCEAIIRRELDISFAGYFVPSGEIRQFPDLLKQAGCTAVELGTDSLSDPVLAALGKGFSADEAITFSRRIAEVEIPQCHNLILGGPGETEQTMEESITRLDAIDPRAVIVTIGLRVFPGTALADMARSERDEQLVAEERLAPVFYIEEAVADTIIDKASAWIDARRGWICPGLGKRYYNLRYFERQREVRGHRGVMWTLF
ncbi:MAG: radical SAM protein [Deltaproteobacteria bacterium]|nr:radical SAM protein [Deltaproteobacteria bacterium]